MCPSSPAGGGPVAGAPVGLLEVAEGVAAGAVTATACGTHPLGTRLRPQLHPQATFRPSRRQFSFRSRADCRADPQSGGRTAAPTLMHACRTMLVRTISRRDTHRPGRAAAVWRVWRSGDCGA